MAKVILTDSNVHNVVNGSLAWDKTLPIQVSVDQLVQVTLVFSARTSGGSTEKSGFYYAISAVEAADCTRIAGADSYCLQLAPGWVSCFCSNVFSAKKATQLNFKPAAFASDLSGSGQIDSVVMTAEIIYFQRSINMPGPTV